MRIFHLENVLYYTMINASKTSSGLLYAFPFLFVASISFCSARSHLFLRLQSSMYVLLHSLTLLGDHLPLGVMLH